MTDKLKTLIEKCACGVHITINAHRDYYETVEQYLHGRSLSHEMEAEVLVEMIGKNTIVDLQFYPLTPIGFYLVLHHDLEAALDQALELINQKASAERRGERP
jgi:glutamate racemase